MTAAIGLLAVGLFAVALRFLKIADIARTALAGSRTAAHVLMDPARDDLEKEKAARTAGVHLLGCSLRIIAGMCVAAVPAIGLVAAATVSGITSVSKMTTTLSSPWMIAGAVLISLPAFFVR
jgi:hypothetical protein